MGKPKLQGDQVGLTVHLADIGASPSATEGFSRLAELDRHGEHRLSADPGAVDVVLFTDLHLLPHDIGLRTLRRHELYRRYPEKCFVYDERDHPWSNLPGLYVSMPRQTLDDRRQVASAYYVLNRPEVPEVALPQHLFSFLGSRSHPLRSKVLDLHHPRAVIEDTTGFVFYAAASDDQRRERYAAVLADSKFVLCPRGAGTASIRLFETLAAGRVPVILSDGWVPPPGPDWDAISVRWPEDDLDGLPAHLECRENQWLQLATGTRAAFDTWFAQDVSWHRLAEGLASLVSAGVLGGFGPSVLNRPRWEAELVHARWCTRSNLRRAANALGGLRSSR
jgi:hypothetical protein